MSSTFAGDAVREPVEERLTVGFVVAGGAPTGQGVGISRFWITKTPGRARRRGGGPDVALVEGHLSSHSLPRGDANADAAHRREADGVARIETSAWDLAALR